MSYIVRCRVSGGVTGTRESVCKKDGEIVRFPTIEEARAYAQKYNKEFGADPYRTANFHYWPEESK